MVVPGIEIVLDFPPVLSGSITPEIKERVESLYISVTASFDAWGRRHKSNHTWRAYRGDVTSFVEVRNGLGRMMLLGVWPVLRATLPPRTRKRHTCGTRSRCFRLVLLGV